MDGIVPVGAEVTPPSLQQGLGSLASILGIQQQRIQIAQQQQNLQTGLYNQQQQQGAAQLQQETMAERQKLQQFYQNGVDDQGNSFKNPAGEVTGQGANVIANWARTNLPLIGNDIAQSVLTTQSNKVSLDTAVQGLQKNYRNDIGGVLSGFIGSNASAQQIDTALDNYARQNPDATEAVHWAESLTPHLTIMPNQQQRDNALSHLVGTFTGQSPQKPTTIETPATIQGGTVNAGTGAITPAGPTIQKPIAPGVAAGPGGTPIRYGPGGAGLPTAQSGAGISSAVTSHLAALQQPASAAPAAQWNNYNAQMQAGGQLVTAARTAANDPMNGVSATRFRNQQILNLIPEADTGPGMRLLNTLASRIPGSSGDAYQDIEHYTALNSAALAQKMGVPNTNLGSETAAAAAGNVERNPGALAEITKTNDALNTAFDLFNRGLAKVSNNGSDPSRVPAYQQAFGQALDINAIRWADAHRRDDSAEMDRLQNLPGFNLNSAQQSLRTLKALADTGDLPNGR